MDNIEKQVSLTDYIKMCEAVCCRERYYIYLNGGKENYNYDFASSLLREKRLKEEYPDFFKGLDYITGN